jgi:Secretion system C-terminal sorting domain
MKMKTIQKSNALILVSMLGLAMLFKDESVFSQNVIPTNKTTLNNQKSGGLRSVKPRYDSIYNWRSNNDIPNPKLEFYQKIADIIYDNNNNILEKSVFEWRDNAWYPFQKKSYQYNSENLITRELIQYPLFPLRYDENIYTYDNNNNLTRELIQSHNDTAWTYKNQRRWTYNNNHNVINEFQDYYNENDSTFSVGRIDTYEYDSVYNLTMMKSEDFNESNGQLRLMGQLTLNYNDKNKIASKVLKFGTGPYAADSSIRTTYKYGENENLILRLQESLINNVWQAYAKEINEFDINNNAIFTTFQLAGDSSGKLVWVNDSKVTSVYDSNNHRTNFHFVFCLSDSSGVSLPLANNVRNNLFFGEYDIYRVNKYYDIFTNFNENNDTVESTTKQLYGDNLFQSGFKYEYDDELNIISKAEYYYHDESTNITYDDSTHYYISYGKSTTIESNEKDSQITISPNPTHDKITVNSHETDINAIEIYNVLGERIYSNSNLNGGGLNEIIVSNLGQGIYIVKIYDGTKVYCKKIIVN